jgi:hypothetical protein
MVRNLVDLVGIELEPLSGRLSPLAKPALAGESKDLNLKALKSLVDLVGIEPTTSSMPWKRAPSCATGPLC